MKTIALQDGVILVPKKDSKWHETIDSGSGIVCFPNKNYDNQRIYFEGNRHGASNLERFSDKVINAAGRSVTQYPTVAMSGISNDDLDRDFIVVGTINCNPDRKPMFSLNLDTDMLPVLSAWSPESTESYQFTLQKAGSEKQEKKSFNAVSPEDAVRKIEAYVKELETAGEKVSVDHMFHQGEDKKLNSLVITRSETMTVLWQDHAYPPGTLPSLDQAMKGHAI